MVLFLTSIECSKRQCGSIRHQELAPKIEKLDHEEGFNREAFSKMGELGLLGVILFLKKTAAQDWTLSQRLICMEEMGAQSTLPLLFPTSLTSILCVTNQISNNANPEQKKKYLPKLISAANGLAGWGCPNPVQVPTRSGMKTKAVRQGDPYVLNGTKTWITNGPVGDVFYCLRKNRPESKTRDRFHPSSWNGECQVSPPVKNSQKWECGLHPRGNSYSKLQDSSAAIASAEENAALSSDAQSGLGAHHHRGNLARLRTRPQLKSPLSMPKSENSSVNISEHSNRFRSGSPKHPPGTKPAGTDLSSRQNVGPGKGQGKEASMMAAKAKLQSAQMATQVCLDAIQILGGYGYTREFPVERYMRDAKLMEIGAGTNEIFRLIIARSMFGDVADDLRSSLCSTSMALSTKRDKGNIIMDFQQTSIQAELRDLTRKFVQKELIPLVEEDERNERFRPELIRKLGGLGLTGIPVPESFGGAGMGYQEYVIAIEELAAGNLGYAISVAVTGLTEVILNIFGNEEQKHRYIPPLARGEAIGAFSLSEAGSGSDAANTHNCQKARGCLSHQWNEIMDYPRR